MSVIKCGSGYLLENQILLWSQHNTLKRNIVLIVPRDPSDGNPECNRVTVKSREVKVRLPLNLKKHEREVRGESTCVVAVYAACQVCICVCVCVPMHNVQTNRRWSITLTCFIEQTERGRMCLRRHVCARPSKKKKKKHTSQQKCARLSEHVSPLMNVSTRYQRITANPEHWLIPQCDASGLNVKKMITLNGIRGQILP